MAWRHSHPRSWIAIKIILAFLLILILAIAGLIFYLNTNSFKESASGWLSGKSNRAITVEGDIEARWGGRWTPYIVINQLQVGNAEWAKEPAMFRVDRMEIGLYLPDLLRGRVTLPELILQKPELALEKNKKGEANWDFTENPESAAVTAPLPDERVEMPMIGRLRITDGTVIYNDQKTGIDTKLGISTVKGEAEADEDIKIDGKGNFQKSPFSITLRGGSVLSLHENEEPYPFYLATTIGGTSAKVEGQVDDPVTMEGLNVILHLKGKSASDLYASTGIALPPTPPYDVRGRLKRDGEKWDFSNFTGKLGNSDLKGSVVWDAGQKPPYFKGEFISENLDLADLGGFIGAKEEKADDGRVIPDTPLDISRLAAMNADVVFKGKHIKTPDLLDDFSMTLALKNGVLDVKPVRFGMAGGQINANVTIDSKKTPIHTAADVEFQKLSLEKLFQPLVDKYGEENVSAGLLGGKAVLKGQGKSLREMMATADGNIGIGMEGGSLSRLLLELAGIDVFKSAGLFVTKDQSVPIRCVVGDFGVSGGVMATRTALIDTKVTTIQGEGKINLKDETMDMRMTVHPKDSTLVSARTPILLKGTLGKPSIGVDAAALAARGGIAAALGVLLTPIGSLLAFVEPGLGEDSQCAAYVRELDKKTGGAIPSNQKANPPVPKNE